MTQLNYKVWDSAASSPFDILFKDFFNTNSTFVSPIDTKIGHPVDIYENANGLTFEIACIGLAKSDIGISVEGDTLRVIYKKLEDSKCCDTNDCKYYHKGIARRSFNLGYKISRRFALDKVDATMLNGLLTITIPFTEESKPTQVKIK